MLEILRRELAGSTVSLYELDEIMTRLGCPSELEWINDDGAWDDVLKDKKRVQFGGRKCRLHTY